MLTRMLIYISGVLLVGCMPIKPSKTSQSYEVPLERGYEKVAADLVAVLVDEIPPAKTTLQLDRTDGLLGQHLDQKLRLAGYAVSNANGISFSYHLDQMDKNIYRAGLVSESCVIARMYGKSAKGDILPLSNWTKNCRYERERSIVLSKLDQVNSKDWSNVISDFQETQTPVSQTWSFSAGDSIKEKLSEWGTANGYFVVWKPSFDVVLKAPITVNEYTLHAGVYELFERIFARTNKRLSVSFDLNQDPKYIYVSTEDVK